MIEEVNNGYQVLVNHSSHVDQLVWMLVTFEQTLEKGALRCQDHLVCFNLLTITTGQGHISEVFVFPETSKGRVHIVLEIIPLEAQLF